MAVLIEALSIIVRRDRLDAVWPGGAEAYIAESPNQTVCADSHLVRIGFMSPPEAGNHLGRCIEQGLTFLGPDDTAQDLVPVDQLAGTLAPCDWLRLGRVEMDGHEVDAAQFVGDEEDVMITPPNWSLRQHLEIRASRIQPEEPPDYLVYVGEKDGLHEYIDTRTGKSHWTTEPLQ